MSSLRRITASRANGALSRGPITPTTRAISAANSLQHGFTAKSVVLANESQPRFQQLLDRYLLHFQPQNDVQSDLVEEMVVAKWRQHRLWSIESATFDLEMDRQDSKIRDQFGQVDEPTRQALAFKALGDESASLHLLSRYEARLRLAYERALLTLQFLQSAPLAAPPKVPNEPNPENEHLLEPAC